MILLDIQHLFKAFPVEGGVLRRVTGNVQALQNVSLHIDEGEVLALVGGSGSGKSTLAKIVAGLLAPDSGRLLWEERELASLTRLERSRRIQMIFQDPYASLNPKLSIRVQLEEVLDFPRGKPQTPAESLLETVGLSSDMLWAHYPFQFSGGQRQRIAIARSLAMNPKLLIADEPLSALDVTTQAQMLDLFDQLKKTYRLTFLFITHDLAVAHRFADRVVVLQDGQKVEEGPASGSASKPHASLYPRASRGRSQDPMLTLHDLIERQV